MHGTLCSYYYFLWIDSQKITFNGQKGVNLWRLFIHNLRKLYWFTTPPGGNEDTYFAAASQVLSAITTSHSWKLNFFHSLLAIWALYFAHCVSQECSVLQEREKSDLQWRKQCFQRSAKIGFEYWFNSSTVSSVIVFLPISWPCSHYDRMATPDPALHHYSRQ